MNDNFDDFLSMLDVKPDVVVSNEVITLPPSKTAMKTDRWHERIASDLIDEWGLAASQEEIADAHTACYEPSPELSHECTDKVRHAWYKDLLESTNFRSLHVSTQADRSLSQIAAKQISSQYQRYVSGLSEEEKKEIEEQAEESPIQAIRKGRSVSAAVADAQCEVDQAVDASNAFGAGDGSNSGIDPNAVMKSYQAVRNNHVLRKISESAGRFIRLAKSLQRQKPTHGMDDIVGVEFSGDISRMLPTEIALLGSELEDDLLRRLVERQVMCREYKGMANLGRGPIMILVDESGSMSGDPIAAAKGFALAMAWLARHQKRWCCLVGWSSRKQVRELVIEPGKSDDGLLRWCQQFWNGGTEPPLRSVPELFEKTGAPKGRTDVIWVTDGECDPSGVHEFNEWRKANEVKVWTVGIDCEAESFNEFSDVVASVREIDTKQPVFSELLSL